MKINRNRINFEHGLIIDGQVFEGVQNFRFLWTLINSKNLKSEKIKSSIAAHTICFYSQGQIFRPRAISKAVQIKIYIQRR
jgi:hypothetical protein